MAIEGTTPEETAELEKRWGEVEQMFKDGGRHVICARTLLLLLAEDGVTWRREWNRSMAEQTMKMLEEANADKTIKKAVEDLAHLAAFVFHDLDRKDLSSGLLIILEGACDKYKLVNIDLDAKFEAEMADREKAVTGASSRPIPAKIGEKAPEGSLRPDQLGKGPRRI